MGKFYMKKEIELSQAFEMSQPSECQESTSQPLQATSSIDGTDEDMLSYWSPDSAASNCDRISSPIAYGVTTIVDPRCKLERDPSSSVQEDTEGHPSLSYNNRASCSSSNKSRCNTNNSNGGKNVRKRFMANERERERTKSLNQALEILRNRLPVSEAEKRSKIQTLRMAKEYIEFLAIVKRLPQHQQQTNEPSDDDSSSLQDQYSKALNSSDQANSHLNQPQQPDSSLTYKFYKFRLKSQTRND